MAPTEVGRDLHPDNKDASWRTCFSYILATLFFQLRKVGFQISEMWNESSDDEPVRNTLNSVMANQESTSDICMLNSVSKHSRT